jgi:2-methylcitrate dehydratase PrpD
MNSFSSLESLEADCVTVNWVRFTLGTTYDALPKEVRRFSIRLVLDSLGCALGATRTERAKILSGLIDELGGKPQATVLGIGRKTSTPQAAFANAELINEMDADAVFVNISHIAPPIVAAALTAAEYGKRTGLDLLRAVAIGHEIAARLALAITPLQTTGQGNDQRWVLSPVSGYSYAILGAAAACALLLDLSESQAAHALGLAAYLAAVPTHLKWIITRPFSMIKYNPMGWTSYGGVLSALLARRGYTGDTHALEGERGLWQVWGSTRCDYAFLAEGLGRLWYGPAGTSFKPYPLCNLYRPHIWMLQRVMHREGLQPEEILSVSLRTNAITSANYDPRAATQILRETDIHMSGAYALAMAAYGITPGPQWLDLAYSRAPQILSFMAKVHAEGNPTTAEAVYRENDTLVTPDLFKRADASIEIHTARGMFTDTVKVAKGDEWGTEQERMSDEELAAKFILYAQQTLDEAHARDLADRLLDLETVGALDGILAFLKTPGASGLHGEGTQ